MEMDFEVRLIIADAMSTRFELEKTVEGRKIAQENIQKVADYLKSIRNLRDDEAAAARLLRTPCNFEPLIDALEASVGGSFRERLDDALRALATTPPAEGETK